MAQGTATGTAASAEALAEDYQRDYVTFQMTDATAAVYFGIGVAAVIGEGMGLRRVGDSVTFERQNARNAINIIGDGGVVSYQTGPVRVVTGPTVLPAS